MHKKKTKETEKVGYLKFLFSFLPIITFLSLSFPLEMTS